MYLALKAAGQLHPDDEAPIYPHSKEYVFDVFWFMHKRRGSNGFSMNPISLVELEAYLRIIHLELTPWDMRLIDEMDQIMLKAARVSAAKTTTAAAGKGKK